MITKLRATFDGEVLRTDEPVGLEPNTRVLITIETVGAPAGGDPSTGSFLRTARSLNLEGPPDWSERLEDYLYGDAEQGGS